MNKKRYFYLLRIQYLGFRFSGWQKQPNHKTIEGMLLKTLKFVFTHSNFKILGAGRTDAKVSSLNGAFELFLDEHPIDDLEEFLALTNKNLPSDIRVTDIEEIDEKFNIIQDGKTKEYTYLFSFGEKNHPFCAPFMANIVDSLDIELMKKGAALFQGTHYFKTYTAKPREQAVFNRTITESIIIENTVLKANFFPATSYMLKINGSGFMRYQIRMIMGALIQLGKGELSLLEIKASLKEESQILQTFVAPGSGLILNKLSF